MNVEKWIRIGLRNGWCSPPLCETHDGVPMTKEEMEEADEGGDPCIHVMRVYESTNQKAEAEMLYAAKWRLTDAARKYLGERR